MDERAAFADKSYIEEGPIGLCGFSIGVSFDKLGPSIMAGAQENLKEMWAVEINSRAAIEKLQEEERRDAANPEKSKTNRRRWRRARALLDLSGPA